MTTASPGTGHFPSTPMTATPNPPHLPTSDRIAKWAPVVVSVAMALGNAVYVSGSHAGQGVMNEKRLFEVEEWSKQHSVEHTQLTARTAAVEMRLGNVETRSAGHDVKLDALASGLNMTNQNVLAVCIATHAQCSR